MENLERLIVGGSEMTADHQDESRATVGWTAYLVACFRAMEATRTECKPLFRDDPTVELFDLKTGVAPFFARVSLEIYRNRLTANSFNFESNFASEFLSLLTKILLLPLYALFYVLFYRQMKFRYTLQWVALRTVFFDENITDFIEKELSGLSESEQVTNDKRKTKTKTKPKVQVVFLGAGLDARMFRLPVLQDKRVKIFEIDFPGMLSARRSLFKNYAYRYTEEDTNLFQCGADLSIGSWVDKLSDAGFDMNVKTIWIVEGLVEYFTIEEAQALFAQLSGLTQAGGFFIAAWRAGTEVGLSILRSRYENPKVVNSLLGPHGWRETDMRGLIADKRYSIDMHKDGNRFDNVDILLSTHEM